MILDYFRKVKYPKMQLTNVQHEAISFIDIELFSMLSTPGEGVRLTVKHLNIPFIQQHRGASYIKKKLRKIIDSNDKYIPRSVAFVQSGYDWHFFIGVYREQWLPDPAKEIMFMDLLTRTNAAREEYDNA